VQEAIRDQGAEARALAEKLAALVRESSVPISHADEVIERLRELLAEPEAPENHNE